MDDRWAKLEEIVRRVVREELSTWNPKNKTKVSFVNGQFTGLGEQELSALAAAFPAVDVKKELKEMTAWILLNPNDAPRSNYGAFVQSWLKKHQDRSAIRSIPTRSEPVQKTSCDYCGKPRTGVTSGITHCSAHLRDALDGVPVKAA